jgi:DNA (cytosine-5)-methyltransferase 1
VRVLDLFSGIGGFSLGLERAGMQTVAFCEIDPYCRAVIKKHWPDIPCHEDVRTIPDIGCDLICGGFPCQPFSVAGKQRGTADDRHLWPAMLEVIKRERPAWVLGENVAGLIRLGLDGVLSDLETEGYSCRTFAIPACSVGAFHRRERLWIVAHAQRDQQPRQESCDGSPGRVGGQQQSLAWHRDWEGALRAFRGMDDGLSYRVDRVDTLRNAVVPQIPEIIGRAIMRAEGLTP